MGWYSPGVVAVCAWEQGLWWEQGDRGFEGTTATCWTDSGLSG